MTGKSFGDLICLLCALCLLGFHITYCCILSLFIWADKEKYYEYYQSPRTIWSNIRGK